MTVMIKKVNGVQCVYDRRLVVISYDTVSEVIKTLQEAAQDMVEDPYFEIEADYHYGSASATCFVCGHRPATEDEIKAYKEEKKKERERKKALRKAQEEADRESLAAAIEIVRRDAPELLKESE